MILMDREERQRGQQPFLGFEQKNSLVEVAFLGKVCLVIIVTIIHVRCAGHDGGDPHRFGMLAFVVGLGAQTSPAGTQFKFSYHCVLVSYTM